ncbi:hypothetical protein H8S33_14800 [Ornithinibacillus sp. BX22]|uniref:Uncharacterized protein n=2 Tax=Ornithinibacillus TaxID=484508 RepID=A0A923L7Z0_9BACI|nr:MULTISPECIES: hypothetical protein [Ornithinibacillus]MBC5638064.1 hypothetical protein [Ornithinibacillus hominis]MBS3680864.1 hypothetical protein [Ornithinibacillus massiliensis]
MKKKKKWPAISVIALLGAGLVFYLLTFLLYEPSEDFYEFPVPKIATLLHKDELTERYEWVHASEENGIPSIYKWVLSKNGWKEEISEGASTLYTNGSHTIDLISTTNMLEVIKVE